MKCSSQRRMPVSSPAFFLRVTKGIGVLHKVFSDVSSLRYIVEVAMSKWSYPEGKRAGAGKRDLLS
jgi:hypothetical protein